jgi:hypothetical protein
MKPGFGLYRQMLDVAHYAFARQMNCAAPWHAGMAFAMGYMLALMKTVQGV